MTLSRRRSLWLLPILLVSPAQAAEGWVPVQVTFLPAPPDPTGFDILAGRGDRKEEWRRPQIRTEADRLEALLDCGVTPVVLLDPYDGRYSQPDNPCETAGISLTSRYNQLARLHWDSETGKPLTNYAEALRPALQLALGPRDAANSARPDPFRDTLVAALEAGDWAEAARTSRLAMSDAGVFDDSERVAALETLAVETASRAAGIDPAQEGYFAATPDGPILTDEGRQFALQQSPLEPDIIEKHIAESAEDHVSEDTEVADTTEGEAASAETEVSEIERERSETAETGVTEGSSQGDQMDDMSADIADRQVAELIGVEIAGADGETIGEITDFALVGQEVVAIVGVGGFLGLGEHLVALPLSDMTFDGERLVLSRLSEEQLRDLPEFDDSTVTILPQDSTLGDEGLLRQ